MEPAEGTVTYIVYARALKIYQHDTLGWLVQFEGSRESISLGVEKLDFEEGDLIKITFTKETKCPPSINTTQPS